MKYNRNEVIQRLLEDRVQQVMEWALRDLDSLREYVRSREEFDKDDDDFLMDLAESQLGLDFEGRDFSIKP